MQALNGIHEFPDSHLVPRLETCSAVVLRLSKFGNLVPLHAHRQVFRKVMGKDQSLTVNDYLLNPIDASRIGSMLQIMPKYRRDLLILHGVYGGSTVSNG
jgi:hypothetical protein